MIKVETICLKCGKVIQHYIKQNMINGSFTVNYRFHHCKSEIKK